MKRALKIFFYKIGLDVSNYRPDAKREVLFFRMLNKFNINVIFDIGANEGQFGGFIRDLGYKGHLVSFEPLTTAYQQLINNSKNDPLWKVAPQMAIGDEDGEITINIANNSESSSVLNMLDSHTQADGGSVYIGSEKVRISKLDSVYSNFVDNNSKVFLKIDTQGFEDRVLRGAGKLLERTVGLQLELSLVPLYSNQKLFDELTAQLKDIGFEIWSINPVFSDPKTGRQLQVDVTLFRSDLKP
jgi:FkbM family methyltransferase